LSFSNTLEGDTYALEEPINEPLSTVLNVPAKVNKNGLYRFKLKLEQ